MLALLSAVSSTSTAVATSQLDSKKKASPFYGRCAPFLPPRVGQVCEPGHGGLCCRLDRVLDAA